jgi:hypothetical protein
LQLKKLKHYTTLRVVANPAFAVINCAFPIRIAGTILPGVTGPAALAPLVLLLVVFFVEALPMSDFFAIAMMTLPQTFDFDSVLWHYSKHLRCQTTSQHQVGL